MTSPERFIESLNEGQKESSNTGGKKIRGINMSNTNNYVSQIGNDIFNSTDRINMRRTTRDYDTQ